MRRALLIAAILLLPPFLFSQEQNRFLIHAGARMSGTEQYSSSKTSSGYFVSGHSQLQSGGAKLEFTEDLALAPDMGLVRYKLEVTSTMGTQTITATRSGETVQMKARAASDESAKTTPFSAGAVVLDNLVTAHFQVLLDSIAGKAPASWPRLFIVPQALAAVPGKMIRDGEESGTLAGKNIKVIKYSVELGSVLAEFWADSSNRLMRVAVPLQEVELVREGFALAPRGEPPQKAPTTFIERAVEFENDSLKFPATLCLPLNAKGKLPVVVLVHGSGPNDRDETIGPNKPFRDLAHGLAAAGIATLRFDKRTFAYKTQINPATLTLEQETIGDAVAAIHFARSLPEANSAAVFVLGHSQGGTFAPVIAERGNAAGAVMMAPLERPFDQALEEQIAFQSKRAGDSDPEIAAQTLAMKAQFARVKSGQAADSEPMIGVTAHYLREFLSHDTVAELRRLKIPVLVLQGGKDVQVTRADYDLARAALADKPEDLREVHWFPELNHLFMPVQGNPAGAEYGRLGQVAPYVIQAIVEWVGRHVAKGPP